MLPLYAMCVISIIHLFWIKDVSQRYTKHKYIEYSKVLYTIPLTEFEHETKGS